MGLLVAKPDHRPNCRCPVNNSRVVVRGRPERRAPGSGVVGGKENRMLLSVTFLLLYNSDGETPIMVGAFLDVSWPFLKESRTFRGRATS